MPAASHPTNTGDIVPLLGDGSQARDKLMMGNTQVIHQFAKLQVPHQKG